MYNFKLEKNEKIILISDDTLVLNKDNIYTTIITTNRLLVLDYPSSYHNPQEELRILNRVNYIKMKEVISEIRLKDITKIEKIDDYHKIIFDNKSITIKDNVIINKLCDII